MSSEAEFFDGLTGILIPRLIALVVSLTLLWKCWGNTSLKRLAIALIIATLASTILEPLLLIQEIDMRNHGKSMFYANFWGALLFLVGSIYEISVIFILGISIWTISHYEKSDQQAYKPIRKITHFIISIFLLVLLVNALYAIRFITIELSDFQISVYSRQLVFIHIFSSYALLLSTYYAIGLIVPDKESPRSTRKTLWLMVVPLFNVYWMVKVLKDWIEAVGRLDPSKEIKNTILTAKLIINLIYSILIFIVLLFGSVYLNIQTYGGYEYLTLGLMSLLFLLGGFYTYRWLELLLEAKRIEANFLHSSVK